MCIYDELEEKLKESFAYSLHDKLIFISGYLDGDDENEDLLDFVNYLLYSEKESISFPKLCASSELQTWSTVNQWQHDNPLPDRSFVDLLKEHFNDEVMNHAK